MEKDINKGIYQLAQCFDQNFRSSTEDREFTLFNKLPIELQKRIVCTMEKESLEACLLSAKHFHTLIDSCVNTCKNYAHVFLEFQRGTCVVKIDYLRGGSLVRLFRHPTESARPDETRFRRRRWTRVIEHVDAMDLAVAYVTALCNNSWIQLVDVEIWDETRRTTPPNNSRHELSYLGKVPVVDKDSVICRMLNVLRQQSWVSRVNICGKIMDITTDALCTWNFERLDIKKVIFHDEGALNRLLQEWVRKERNIFCLGIDYNDSGDSPRIDTDKLFEGMDPIFMRVERDRTERTELSEAYFSYKQYRIRRDPREALFIRVFPYRIMCWVP